MVTEDATVLPELKSLEDGTEQSFAKSFAASFVFCFADSFADCSVMSCEDSSVGYPTTDKTSVDQRDHW